jgi:hypothetical protein
MHDATAARNEAIDVCFQRFPDVEVLLDDGCLCPSRDRCGQSITPPRKPRPGTLSVFNEATDRVTGRHEVGMRNGQGSRAVEGGVGRLNSAVQESC